MTYQVNIGDKILYYPGSQSAQIFDTELNQDVGLAGEFTFKVPVENDQYASLSTGALITILRDGVEYWRGEIADIKTDFDKASQVYAIEDLAWLGNEFMAPALVTNQTYAQRFQTAISNYNANRSADRQFTAGYITNVSDSATCKWQTEYEWSILDSLRQCIGNAGSETGYLRVRRSTSGGVVTRYIDIVKLSDYGMAANQQIEYGYNLLNYVKDMDYSNLTNVLTPYGAEQETEVYSEYNARLQGTTITNADSVSTYGRHARAVVFDDVDNLTKLNALAASYLTRYCQPRLTMEVNAVDLAGIENVSSINIGDSVRIIAKPFAIDQTLYLTQIRRDIQNIDKNTITLSGEVHIASLTSQLNSAAGAIDELPTTYSVLEAAKKNALAMLLSETQGGHVIFEYDPTNSYIEAISICDAATINASLKRWRWSQGGFGYMYRAHTTDPWTGPNVAMTMNGSIVADFITSGTMQANRIKGGTLTLGGDGNGNGWLKIVNAANQQIGKWDKDGISVGAGSITGGSISGTSISGATISGGTITGTAISGGTINIGSGKFNVDSSGNLSTTGGASINGSVTSASGNNSAKVQNGVLELVHPASHDFNALVIKQGTTGNYQECAIGWDDVYWTNHNDLFINDSWKHIIQLSLALYDYKDQLVAVGNLVKNNDPWPYG